MADNDGLWSVAPFVSYDGGDGKGGAPAEVSVSKGVAIVKEIDNRGRSANVHLSIPGKLKRDITGWINTDDPAFAIAEQHYKTGDPVAFRQESQRKKDVDRSIPISELRKNQDIARDNTIKLFVGFGEPDGEIVLSGQHMTSPLQDPGSNSSISADSATAASRPTQQSRQNYAPANGEARPWIGKNNDGKINPGSYGVAYAPTMYFFLLDNFPEADDATLRSTASELLRIADVLQVKMYRNLGSSISMPNRLENSHLVARKLIQSIIEHMSAMGLHVIDAQGLSDSAQRSVWKKDIAKSALSLWEWSVSDYEGTLQ